MSNIRKLTKRQQGIKQGHQATMSLEYDQLTKYIEYLARERRGGRWRNIQGQFISDAHQLGGILITLVKKQILSLNHDLAKSTIYKKKVSLGKDSIGEDANATPLVLGNTGKFVDEPLMHTGHYYDAIGFTDSQLSLNRHRKLVLNATKTDYTSERRNLVNVGATRLSKRRTDITIGINGGNKPIYPATGGKLWTVDQIAAFHEYGTMTEPARPVWGPAINEFNAITQSGGLFDKVFSKTYRAVSDLLLGTPDEIKELNKHSGTRVRDAKMFPSIYNKASFVRSLYETNFSKRAFPVGRSWGDTVRDRGGYRYIKPEGEDF